MAEILRANTQQAPAQQPAGGSDDRRSKQSKSSAAALAASAMLKVMCLKEMADAQRENDSEKMSRAMMMCAQADAMAQNGKENEEGSKKSGSGPVAASPQFEKPNLNTEVKPDEFDSSLLGSQERILALTPSVSPDLSGTVKNSEILPTEEKGTFSEDKSFSSGASSADNKGTPLSDSGKLTLNESPVTAFPMGGFLPDNNTRSPASLPSNFESTGFMKPDSVPTETTDSQKEKGGSNGEAPAASGFDQMLAKYMGAGANNSISSASLSGGIVDIAYGLKVSGERPKTIFEFASEQYQQKRPGEPHSRAR